ncbi:mitochondrial ribonuclease P catalytic subunit [Aplochiton taeniatus]
MCTKGVNQRPTVVRNNKKTEDRQRNTSFVVRERPAFPKSVFAAGTAKRTAEILSRKEAMMTSMEEEEQQPEPLTERSRAVGRLEPPGRPLSAAEWKILKKGSANPDRFDVQMMSALFISKAELNIARSLLAFVAMETGNLSYELLLRYLTLCVSGGHNDEVSELYDLMRGKFKSFDTGAYSLFLKSMCKTKRWRECLTILNDLKKVFTPSPRNYEDAITGALQHSEPAIAWALYDEIIEKGLNPHQETLVTLFQGGMTGFQIENLNNRPKEERLGPEEESDLELMSLTEYNNRLLGVLLYMRDNQLYPQQSLASIIKDWFESLPKQKWRGTWTTPDLSLCSGACQSCKANLESIQLTQEEYQQLKERVMADVIQGRDVFTKTTPEELDSFKAFVKRKPAFDVVIDGLNVANITRGNQSETLLAVVSELEKQGLVVLVLGRKHMLRPSRSWDRQNMALIQKKAHCFFTDNISEDDPFLLYATLNSGNQCRFVSRDLMRDHKACLPDGATRRLFFKWQRGHQLVLYGYAPGRRVRFQSVPSYDTIIQNVVHSWHIPYDEKESERCSYEVPQRWLCLNETK